MVRTGSRHAVSGRSVITNRDIIFFDWGGDGVPDHVGIVEKTEGGTVYTVEGNSGDACRENSYPVGDARIYGYGVPMYS